MMGFYPLGTYVFTQVPTPYATKTLLSAVGSFVLTGFNALLTKTLVPVPPPIVVIQPTPPGQVRLPKFKLSRLRTTTFSLFRLPRDPNGEDC